MDLWLSLSKTIGIAVLLVISAAGLLGFAYVSLKTLNPSQPYEEKKKYAIVGGVCVFLGCVGLSIIALIRQPVLELLPVFLFLSLVVGGLMYESIISPTQLANWWKKRAKRKR